MTPDEAVEQAVSSARLDGHELSVDWVEQLRTAARGGTEIQLLDETVSAYQAQPTPETSI